MLRELTKTYIGYGMSKTDKTPTPHHRKNVVLPFYEFVNAGQVANPI